MEKGINKLSLAVGLAYFAALFGAGNLIFPPYMGLESGKHIIGFVMFLVMDVVFSCMGMIAESKRPEHKMSTLTRAGQPIFVFVTFVAMALLVLTTIPRTCATAFEIGVHPLLPGIPAIAFSIVFFLVTLILAIKPGKVVDNVGKILTPFLIIGIIAIVVKGFITPLGTVSDTPQIDNLFAEGVMQGYQTYDALAAPTFAIVYIISVRDAGFTEPKQMSKVLLRAAVIAGVCLTAIYGGLFYLGAQLSSDLPVDQVTQTSLVSMIVERLMGRAGLAIFAIVVVLACITTAISTAAATAQYWMLYTKDKIKYEYYLVATCCIGVVLSILGVSRILAIAAPVLSIIFPAYLTFIVLTLFTNYIKNDNVFVFAVVAAIAFSVFQLFGVPVLGTLPGHTLSLGWVIPTVICGIIGHFVPSKVYRDPVHRAAHEAELAANDNK